MAHRGGKGPDPFSQKRNRFDRFAQMSKQEEMIQQKKREIQAKLEAQKRKEAEDALKKLAASNLNKSGSKRPLSKSSSSSSGRSREVKPSLPAASGPLNIFSNDGSFMDQFRKLAGVKDGKQSHSSRREDKRFCSSSEGQQSESSRDREHRDSYRDRDRDRDRDVRDYHDDRHRDDRRHERVSSRSSRNYDRRSWENDDRPNKPWHTNDLPRPSSPYSPTLSPPPSKHDVSFPFPPPSMNLPPPLGPPQQQQQAPLQFSQPPPNQFLPFNPTLQAPLTASQAPLTTSVPPPQLKLLLAQPPSIPPPPPPSLETHLVPPPPAPPNLVPGLLPPHLVQQLSAAASQYSAVNPQFSIPQFPPPPAVLSVPPPGGNLTDVKPQDSSGSVVTGPTLVSTEAASSIVGLPIAPPTASVFCPGLKTEPPDGTLSAGALHLQADARGPEGPGQAVRQLAQVVSQCGDDIEEIIKCRNPDDLKLWFLYQKDSEQYKEYRRLVAMFRGKPEECENDKDRKDTFIGVKREIDDEHSRSGNGLVKTEPMDSRDGRHGNDGKAYPASSGRKRVRRSRWGDPEDTKVSPPAIGPAQTMLQGLPSALPPTNIPPPVLPTPNLPPPIVPTPNAVLPTGPAPLLSRVNRTDPALLRYAIQAFGTSNLSEEDWKKAEDHFKINLLYQDMLKKRAELEKLQQQGKFKYEYDSDEETEGGTWEHRLRSAEMEATERWADELTAKAQGKHHIGDFLPPDELARFMEKYSALQEDREPDLSDYKEFKLKEDNIGFQMLQKLGWSEGQGLGADGSGIVDPVNKASNRLDNQGLGLERPDDVAKGDDEFEAYRKRMMLAYRFRPNPLNNPRRPYY